MWHDEDADFHQTCWVGESEINLAFFQGEDVELHTFSNETGTDLKSVYLVGWENAQ